MLRYLPRQAVAAPLALCCAAVSAQSNYPMRPGRIVVPFAAAGKNRLPSLPEVPTFLESGVAGMEIGTMFGLLAPSKTPPEVVQRLYDTLAKAGRGTQFRNQIIELGAEIVLNDPPEYAAYIRNDVARWKDLLPRIGVSQ